MLRFNCSENMVEPTLFEMSAPFIHKDCQPAENRIICQLLERSRLLLGMPATRSGFEMKIKSGWM